MLKRILLLIGCVLAGLSLGNAQAVSAAAGYAIITPQGGSISSLTAVATTVVNTSNLGAVQTDVPPSPLLMSGVLPVNIGTTAAIGTSLTLVNPLLQPATVNLAVTTPSGFEISNRTIMVRSREQFSQPVNELFADQLGLMLESNSLLTIKSNSSIAALALDFRGAGFTPVPITNLAGAFPVFHTTVTPASPIAIPPSTAVAQVLCVPTTVGIVPGICVPVTIGVAPVACVPTIGITVSTPCVTTTTVTPPITTAQLHPASIPGIGTIIFPEVFFGPEITTNLTIGNAAASTQAIRIDLFNSDGDLIKTVSNIRIPSRGLIIFPLDFIGVVPTQ